VSGSAWRRAGRADIPALSAFLSAREESCAGFSGRLLRSAPEAAPGAPPELRLPSSLRGGVWIAEKPDGALRDASPRPAAAACPRVVGALLCHPSGLAFPVFPAPGGGEAVDDEGLRRALGLLQTALIWRPASAAGSARDVERFEAIARIEPLVKVEYLSMSLGADAAARFAQRVRDAPFPGRREGAERADTAFSVRRASAADLDALYPLQEAYEREEVLTPIHDFNPEASRAALARSIELQMIYVAEEAGPSGSAGRRRIVAKAGTNARGFRVDQIGGVYTLPERRGRGAAAALMSALLAAIGGAGKAASLFVKPANAPALALYRGLGFSEIGGYRADYFLER